MFPSPQPSSPPLAQARRAAILARLSEGGAVRISDIVDELGVSDMTARRDIAELAKAGLATKVHGGAVATQRAADEPGFTAKSTLNTRAKMAIARQAATLVRPGDAVALSAGTTTFAVTQELAAVPDLTIVTNSVAAANFLAAHPREDRTTILTGGERTPSDALVGPVAEASLAGLRTDWLFLGTHGAEASAGLTTPNVQEAGTNRALIDGASRTVLVADASKWGRTALRVIAPLQVVDIAITDASTVEIGPAADLISEIREVHP